MCQVKKFNLRYQFVNMGRKIYGDFEVTPRGGVPPLKFLKKNEKIAFYSENMCAKNM